MQDPFSGLDTTTGEMKMTNEDGSPEHLVLSLNKEDEVRVESKLHWDIQWNFKVMSTPVDDIEVEEGLEVGEELNLTPDPLPEVSRAWD